MGEATRFSGSFSSYSTVSVRCSVASESLIPASSSVRTALGFLWRLTLGVLSACVHMLPLAGPLRHSRAWRKERQVRDGRTRARVRLPAQLRLSSACTHSGLDSKTQQWNNVRAVKVRLKRVRHLLPTLTDFSQCLATEKNVIAVVFHPGGFKMK